MEELMILVVLESHGVGTSLSYRLAGIALDHKDVLVHLFVFFVDVLIGFVKARLKGVEHLAHEIRVGVILPIVEFGYSTIVLEYLRLFNYPVYSELFQEVFEQKILVNAALDVTGQLT